MRCDKFCVGGTVALLAAMIQCHTIHAAALGGFDASGTATQQAVHANVHFGGLTGQANPGGAFSGTFSQKVTGGGKKVDGTAVFDFGGGDVLNFGYHLVFNEDAGLYIGSYVVTGGQGALANANGTGWLITERGPVVDFWLSGTLN